MKTVGCRSATIIFPPYAYSAYNGPYLAPALLSAILNKNNIPSKTVDLNIKSIRKMLVVPFIREVRDHVYKSRGLFSPQELALMDWMENAVSTNLQIKCRSILRLFFYLIRKISFVQPPTLSYCLSDQFASCGWRQKLYEDLLSDINISSDEVIAFSVAFGQQLPETIQLCRLLRKEHPDNIIVLGGGQINLLDSAQISELASTSLFDTIVIGNAEVVITDIISGAHRRPKAHVERVQPLGRNDLIGLPVPHFNKDEFEDYFGPLNLPILVTKGCYWGKCTFCDYAKMNKFCSVNYITRPADEVLDEMEEHRATTSVALFSLISDGVSPSWYSKLAKQAIERRIPLRTWSYMLHSKSIDSNFFKLLRKAGVHSVNFGSETTCDRLLQKMNKATGSEIVKKNIKDAHEAGLKVVMNMIIDFPSISFEEAICVANDIADLEEYIDILNPQPFDLTSGTPLADTLTGCGHELADQSLVSSRHGYHSIELVDQQSLSSRQRNTIYSIFMALASKRRLAMRLKRLEMPSKNNDLVCFDKSILLYRDDRDGQPLIDIVSLRSRWELTEYEWVLFVEISKLSSRSITLSNLQHLWHRCVPTNSNAANFGCWIDKAWKSGVIEDVKRG